MSLNYYCYCWNNVTVFYSTAQQPNGENILFSFLNEDIFKQTYTEWFYTVLEVLKYVIR